VPLRFHTAGRTFAIPDDTGFVTRFRMPFLITDQAPGDQLRTLAGGKAHNLYILTARLPGTALDGSGH